MASPQAMVLGALLFLAMAVGYSSAAYCVCKDGVSDAVLQKTIDYACGNGADCSPIRPNGVCYNPNSLKAHCSYAVNSYYQKKSQVGATCDFGGTATLTNSNPGGSGCSFPATGSAAGSPGTTPSTSVPSTSPTTPTTPPGTTTPVSGTPSSGTPVSGTPGSGTPVSGTPGSTTPVSGTPTTSSPYTTAPTSTGTTNPSTGTAPYLGGVGSGLAPTGVGMNDENQARKIGLESATVVLCSTLVGLVVLLWN